MRCIERKRNKFNPSARQTQPILKTAGHAELEKIERERVPAFSVQYDNIGTYLVLTHIYLPNNIILLNETTTADRPR